MAWQQAGALMDGNRQLRQQAPAQKNGGDYGRDEILMATRYQRCLIADDRFDRRIHRARKVV